MTDFKNQPARRPGVHAPAHLSVLLTALAAAALLSACGGGGGNPGAVGPNTSGSTGSTTGTTGSTTGGTTGTTGSTGTTGGTTATVATPASLQFVQAAPADKSIVIKGQGGNGRTETATLTFKLVDVNNNPLAGQAVDFSTTSTDVTLNTASAKTDSAGQVSATVNSGSKPATFRVQAKVTGTGGKPDLTTLSDSITVTTGLPTQASFSMSTDLFNVEGLNYDSSPTTPAARIQVLLADAFGNPVADGTPIVFQTNVGAVGSSDRGGCTTVNGGCSADFRAQYPRTPVPGQPQTACNTTGSDGKGAGISADVNRPGVATVCASSTTGATTLFGSLPIVLSGSDVGHVFVDSVTKEVDLSSGTGDLGALSAGTPRTVALQIDDINQNMMPAGTKVEITSPQNVTIGAVLPATVPNTALGSSATVDPSGKSGYSQGSWHKFSVTSASTCPAADGQTATFVLTVTTPGPKGQTTQTPTVSSIPFKLSITCP
jgi:hypothetical protein